MIVDPLGLAEDVDQATARLLATVRAFDDEDVKAPSGLPGWTRGHVLTHLARNADGSGNLLTWARTGVETPQYLSLEHRAAGVRAIHADVPGFMRAFTDETAYAEVRAEFVAQVRPLVAAGAEVVIPAGGLAMMLFARESPFVIDGAVVLNGIATVAKAAEMALALHRLTGASVSRRGTYAKAPDEAVNEFLGTRW